MTVGATMDNTMGALFVGVICTSALLGAIAIQTWFYFNAYRNDPIYLKLLVGTVFLMSTADQAMTSAGIYQYVITHFFDPPFLGTLTRVIVTQNFLNLITTFLVQSYFVHRIWHLTRGNITVVVILSILTLAQAVIAITFTIRILFFKTFSDLYTRAHIIALTYNSIATVTNIAITGVLCTVLLTSRNEFARTQNLLDKGVSYIISTGLFTTIFVIVGLASYVIAPKSAIYICVLYLTGRMHCVSLLTSLHLRPQEVSIDSKHSQSVPFNLSISDRPPSRPLQFVNGGMIHGRRDDFSEVDGTMDKLTI